MKTAVYAGSFDPVTNGHIDIIERAAKVFDRVYVAVAKSTDDKQPLFTFDERVTMIRESVRHIPEVEVDQFSGLLVDFVKARGSTVVVRGLRAVSDFEYEFQMAQMNKELYSKMETLFMMTRTSHAYLSSRIIKEIASYGGDVSQMVPACVNRGLKEKYETG
ncbi:MAG: pantetheine-phosphate adenylyltransferase [Armatimonadetes bacterium CG2_30_59_28]|nr:pantetheine-phosphate adenylyltransferase [Armatimonadota bacterium]OIO91622.1 MAG: pantetheine-phosphate adenylyltransferase [Armatimonadetes bacterium CG2_30_59_28]PIU61981.1 MAG: pantetheine-phosphate adenylyltransferase [Armatimonadetes bacterium CG07_land_8_20_14_0_80_59_28]PIX45606.1 MAG: pantetheine-phosphate adenylyltransferase [Armatimonadetes bacterium CG_4_8_14_3_um_filter_58_9]PIY45412.1 MAG: pantetheine-phosphate adenylyltransferase [Armatimonadetes bacterium CG_4_10_14_3_um_fil